jgi:hypothetical protein
LDLIDFAVGPCAGFEEGLNDVKFTVGGAVSSFVGCKLGSETKLLSDSDGFDVGRIEGIELGSDVG